MFRPPGIRPQRRIRAPRSVRFNLLFARDAQEHIRVGSVRALRRCASLAASQGLRLAELASNPLGACAKPMALKARAKSKLNRALRGLEGSG
jgi:hypothetical protein